MLVVPNQDAPRLGLGQIMTINKSQGLLPRIRGWVQGTTRRLPDCPRCGASAVSGDEPAVRFNEPSQDHVCDACGLGGGIEKGPIVRQVAQKNLITREFWQVLLYNYYGPANIGKMIVFISNDDTGVHELKGIAETTMNGTVNSGEITASKNTVAEYYTYTYTFSAPGTNRVIRQIGMNRFGGFYGSASNANWKMLIANSVTELSSEIPQSTTETFEVVYKYQFSEVTP